MVTAETPNVRTTRAGITGAFGGPALMSCRLPHRCRRGSGPGSRGGHPVDLATHARMTVPRRRPRFPMLLGRAEPQLSLLACLTTTAIAAS